MKEIFNQIVEHIKKISEGQDSFSLPEIKNAEVKTEVLEALGATLFKRRFLIENEDGKIEILYESKDKCRTNQIKPDWNKVKISYCNKNGKNESYTDGWSDKI